MHDELVPVREPTTPLTLIRIAVEKGLDPEQLGKLLDLQERYDKARAVEAFNAAMNAAQAEMPIVLRDAENSHTKTRYARLESVNNIIKPVYSRHGFSVSYGEQDSPLAGHVRLVADVKHAAGHTEHYRGDFPLDGVGAKGNQNMTAIQGKGSTIAYGRRYLALMIWNVTIADEDQDGNTAFLTPEQIKEINELYDECKKLGDTFEFAKFLKWLGVENLEQAGPGHYAKAIHELNGRRRKAQGEKR